jgi:hypothetical protein
LFLDPDDSAAARRKLYGRAGSHRPKEYGVEYRALSPWWLLTPTHATAVYYLVSDALKLLSKEKLEDVLAYQGAGGRVMSDIVDQIGGSDEVQRIINESDVEAAKEVWNSVIINYLSQDTLDYVSMLGMDDNEDAFYTSWQLTK